MTTTPSAPEGSRDSNVWHLLRELAPQVLGAVARRHGDFAAAEDAVQEALIAAASQWPTEGIPNNPRGWLFHVALRRMTDHVRSELARRRREEAIASEASAIETVVPTLFPYTTLFRSSVEISGFSTEDRKSVV